MLSVILVNVGVHLNIAPLLVASYDVTSVGLTLSPLTTGATSRWCSSLILTPDGNQNGKLCIEKDSSLFMECIYQRIDNECNYT